MKTNICLYTRKKREDGITVNVKLACDKDMDLKI